MKKTTADDTGAKASPSPDAQRDGKERDIVMPRVLLVLYAVFLSALMAACLFFIVSETGVLGGKPQLLRGVVHTLLFGGMIALMARDLVLICRGERRLYHFTFFFYSLDRMILFFAVLILIGISFFITG